MAYGLHWEWRGFGALEHDAEARVLALPAAFPTPQLVTDEYCWLPGLALNLKLRTWPGGGSSLKLKRLRRRSPGDDLQLYEEAPEDDLPFPLAPAALGRVAAELGLAHPLPEAPIGQAEFLQILRMQRPQSRVVTVTKLRQAYRHSGVGGPVLVELCRISAPETVTSVGIEDLAGLSSASTTAALAAARQAVRAAAGVFGAGLAPASYLEALDRWAAGGSVLGGG